MAVDRVADGLFVAGGMELASQRLSWLPPGARGALPINSYLLVEGADCVIVDAGVPAHEETLLKRLDALAPVVQRMKLIITRGVEFDTIGNVTAILRTQPIESVHSHFPSSSWFRLDPRFDVDDDGAHREAAVPFRGLQVGEPIPVARSGLRMLEVLEPALRLLQTAWLYDVRTGTLFTSDAFGWVLAPPEAPYRIIDHDHDQSSVTEVEAGLRPKFGWLQGADTGPTMDAIRLLFDTLDVQAIAPTTGCVLRGPAVVRRHVDMVLEILERWGGNDGV